MIRNIITAVIASVAMLPAVTAAAQSSDLASNQRLIGYTVSDDIDVKGAYIGTAGTYTIGAYMPASKLEDYKGCKVVGIRVAAGVDLGRTSVLLQKITDNAVTDLHTQKQRLYEGWNSVFFNGFEYEITGDEDLFYGFEYTETTDMISAKTGGIDCVGEDTTDAFMLYQSNNYYSVSGAGKLCVQLIVDVTNMPANNMSFGLFDYGFKYKQVGEDLEIYTQINNTGLDDVKSFRMACRIDDAEPEYVTVDEETVPYGGSYIYDHTYSLSGVGIGGHTVTVYVDQINGENYDGTAKAQSAKFAIYSESLQRNAAYMEIYGDQADYNSALLDEALEITKRDLGSKMITVKTFYPTNNLGVADAAPIHELYAYTYPCFSVNRSHFPGEPYVSYDVNDYLAYGMPDLIGGILDELVMQDAENPSFASLELSGDAADTESLHIHASGEILPEVASIYGDMTLTLMVVEDNVVDKQMTTSGRKTYTYTDVLRGYAAKMGDIVIDGTQTAFDLDWTAAMPKVSDPNNLRIVGILTQAGTPTAANLYDFDVINAAECSLVYTSVANIEAESSEAAVYYNLQGQRVANPDRGIYIRVTGTRAEKVAL
jgi:hypothetical protein